jgi:hypothetical protein
MDTQTKKKSEKKSFQRLNNSIIEPDCTADFIKKNQGFFDLCKGDACKK